MIQGNVASVKLTTFSAKFIINFNARRVVNFACKVSEFPDMSFKYSFNLAKILKAINTEDQALIALAFFILSLFDMFNSNINRRKVVYLISRLLPFKKPIIF